MTPSQSPPGRWPNPNVAASASENGPSGVMVNDPRSMPSIVAAASGPQPRLAPSRVWPSAAGGGPRGDQDRGAVLLGAGHPGGQPGPGHRLGGRGHLAPADLREQVPARG